jgi:hypothetical protein
MKSEKICKRFFQILLPRGRVELYDTRAVGVPQLFNSSRVRNSLEKLLTVQAPESRVRDSETFHLE